MASGSTERTLVVPRRVVRRPALSDRQYKWILLLPAVVVVVGLTIFPLLFSLGLTFTNWDLYNLGAGEMKDQAVEEFAKYFIGRPNHWVEIVKRSPLNQRPAAPPPKPKAEPRYAADVPQQPQAAPDEKKGLLGSIKNIIKKD